MNQIDIPSGKLDFVFPSETAGYVVAVFVNGGVRENDEVDDDEFAPTEMMTYGPFVGEGAEQEARDFAERYVIPGNPWRLILLQSTRLYRCTDRFREMVTTQEPRWHWTPNMVAATLATDNPANLVSPKEADLILDLLGEEGVLKRDDFTQAWTFNPDHRRSS